MGWIKSEPKLLLSTLIWIVNLAANLMNTAVSACGLAWFGRRCRLNRPCVCPMPDAVTVHHDSTFESIALLHLPHEINDNGCSIYTSLQESLRIDTAHAALMQPTLRLFARFVSCRTTSWILRRHFRTCSAYFSAALLPRIFLYLVCSTKAAVSLCPDTSILSLQKQLLLLNCSCHGIL